MKSAEAKEIYSRILERFPKVERSFMGAGTRDPDAGDVALTLKMIKARVNITYNESHDSRDAAAFLGEMRKAGLVKE